MPMSDYLRAQQAERARSVLRTGMIVADAVPEAGCGSNRAFYEHGAPRLAMAPNRYRTGGRGERIKFTSIDTPIGVVVAASTARGVCSVQIGHDEDELVRGLKGEFAHASIERDDVGLADLAEVLAGAVRGEYNPAMLPLDLEGTPFQIRVWEALRTIPIGRTRTYSQVAAEINAPRAVRAVAGACGANHVALVVPCHRVIRHDGTLGGNRWGIDTKQALLARESANAAR